MRQSRNEFQFDIIPQLSEKFDFVINIFPFCDALNNTNHTTTEEPIFNTHNNEVLKYAKSNFNENKKKYASVINGFEKEVNSTFNNVYAYLSKLEVTKLVFSITRSDSIYFRFYSNPAYETHLEVFYKTDDQTNTVEAVATTYDENEIILQQYGSLEVVFNEIEKTTCNIESEYTENTIEPLYATISS